MRANPTIKTAELWAGTSGLVLPLPNKKAFPEEFRAASRLTYYASLFNSIEINSTFYKIPMPATFSRWARETPDHFQFTVKLWRGITHAAGLQFQSIDIQRFLHAANHLEDRRGCLLIQLPPGLNSKAAGQLDQLLATIRRSDPASGWKLAVEFRNRSWYAPETAALLRRYRATLVLHDMPASAISELPRSFNVDLPGAHEPATDPATPHADPDPPAWVYLRFHGPAGDYKGGYTEQQLKNWAERIKEWLDAGKDVYVYFNNTIGDALIDLGRLRSRTQSLTSSSSAAAAAR